MQCIQTHKYVFSKSRMSAFPCSFSVFPAAEFQHFGQQALPNGQLGVVGCVLLDSEATPIDRLKFCVFGPATIAFRVRADIMVRIPEASGVFLQAAAAGPEASPAVDRAALEWCDLYDLIKKKTFLSVDQAGALIPAEALRQRLAARENDQTDVGAAIRWAVAVSDDKQPRFEMHYLPAPLHIVTRSD